jgi:hypothetical protein
MSVRSEVARTGTVYISRITVFNQTADVTIAWTGFGDIGYFKNISLTTPDTNYRMSPIYTTNTAFLALNDLSGVIAIGTGESLQDKGGSWEFTSATAPVNNIALDEGIAQIRYIGSNNTLFTGDVVLKEGANVILTDSYDPVTQTTSIVISSTGASTGGPFSGDIPLSSGADVMNALVAKYGDPVISINGQKPGPSGNINFIGDGGITVENTDSGLKISNEDGQPCCGDNELAQAYAKLNLLNSNMARLADFYAKSDAVMVDLRSRLDIIERQTRVF